MNKSAHHREHRVSQGKQLLLPVLAIHHAFDSVSEAQNIEVDEQTHAHATKPHVREKLSFVDWMDRLYRLHFDNDSTLDHQIDAISDFKLVSFVNHRQGDFHRHIQTTVSEFMCKAGLIGAFKKPGSESRVDLHRGIYDGTGDLVYRKSVRTRGSSHG